MTAKRVVDVILAAVALVAAAPVLAVAAVGIAKNDPRVFPFGALLRRTKVDELPQLYNVLRGDMAIVGPRPEDPGMVARFYTPLDHETFRVAPGLTSPGSIYAYTHGEAQLDARDAEGCYGERLLPLKLALDIVYVRRASLSYDLALIVRTAWMLGTALLGRREFPLPPELNDARGIMNERGADRMTA